MPKFETVHASKAYRDSCEDRIGVFAYDSRTVIVVADGAGGIGSGDVAAEAVVREIAAAVERTHSANHWAEVLRQIDHRLPSGESTAVVVDFRPYGIAGASVGDSAAWVIDDGAVHDLTAGQLRKPLLGTGEAVPVAFMHSGLSGLLIASSDGFCSYANPAEVTALSTRCDFHSFPRVLIESVRLPSGELWDDTSVIAVRNRPTRTTRKRYSI